jgi:hypothetical protein
MTNDPPTDPAKETLHPVIQTPSVHSEPRWDSLFDSFIGGLPARTHLAADGQRRPDQNSRH